jgi:hypothetical protein
MDKIYFVDVRQANDTYSYLNVKEKIHKVNAAVFTYSYIPCILILLTRILLTWRIM